MPEIYFPTDTDTPPRTDFTTTPWVDPVNGGLWRWSVTLSVWSPVSFYETNQDALDIGAYPNTLTVTGITMPIDSNPLILTLGGVSVDADGNATQYWHAGAPGSGDPSISVGSVFGVWSITVGSLGSYTYEATKISSAKTPVGLTDWTIITGVGQPAFEGNDKFPSYIGQLGTSYPTSAFGVGGPPWFRWDGSRWREDVTTHAYDDLTDKDMVDLPAVNTPLASALALLAPRDSPVFYSDAGTGATISSGTGPGARISSDVGDYHSIFGYSGIDQSFVARVKGAFGWFRGAFTGRIHPPDTLATNRTWTLPDANGTLALLSDVTAPTLASLLTTLGIPTYADLTAANTDLLIGKPFYNTALSKLDITTA